MALKKTTTQKKTSKKEVVAKPAAKKTTAGQAPAPAAARTATAKKAGVASAKPKPIAEKQTKLQIVQAVAEDTGLERKQVEAVFGSLAALVRRHMQKRGSGEFSVPDIGVKILRARKPATKARKGRNPATGEEITIAAKPAHDVIRLSALKALKDTLI